MDRYRFLRKAKEPRKIRKVKSSKYEGAEMIHDNKKYWESIFNGLSAPSKGPLEEKEINLLSEVLPNDLCDKVCNILHIGVISKELKGTDNVEVKTPRRLVKEPLLSYRKTLNINRELDSDTDVEFISSDEEESKTNIHKEFLKKPEREQITWNTRYLEPEREDEKSLVKRANDLTDRIAHNFCDYMKQLGGDQQSQLFTPKAIKELFQIEFDTHVARSLKVVPKEMPTVQERIAIVTGNPERGRLLPTKCLYYGDCIRSDEPQHPQDLQELENLHSYSRFQKNFQRHEKRSEFAALGREITKDIKAEYRADNICAFNRSLPRREQWRTPRNNTKIMWRSARHVPRDLVTLKTVWDGITNLRSVKEYCRWMMQHPEYRRAPYLRSLGMFDSAVLNARLTFELQQQMSPPILSPTDIPAPIEHIRRRLSELADTPNTSCLPK